ncbi:unnamed protein product [Allacma fusca]|uniref:Uncharacterized protein n=1 Tax=Allacma fusca TaxID=39272 RepID=A0A8J2NRN1_9HEXA|nr:unnamed protein product [Allacma fusca]
MLGLFLISFYIYSAQALTVQDIISQPRARIYLQSEFTSQNDFIDYAHNPKDICLSVRARRSLPKNRIESIETYGTCVRIFRLPLCLGESLAIYPGSPDPSNSKIFKDFGSIGPCFENEFENAYVEYNGNKTIVLKEAAFGSTPDLIEFGGLRYRKNSTKVACGTSAYSQGYKDRLEFVTARINKLGVVSRVELTKLKITDAVQRFYDSLEKLRGDVLGWALPLEFKGSSEASYNVFPQARSAKEKWAIIITEVLKEKLNVLLQVNFIYPHKFSTRPSAFVYRFYNQGLFKYGVVSNAPETTILPFQDLSTLQYLKDTLRSPRVELTVRSNFTGDSTEDYNFSQSKCKNRYVSSDDEAISVKTFGTCVRLFEDSHCKGWSLAIYPGSANLGDSNVRLSSNFPPEQAEVRQLNSKLNWVFSLGPCFENEFDHAKIRSGPKGKVIVKDPALTKTFASIPDVLDAKGDENKDSAFVLPCPIQEVSLGHNGRVEYLKATLSDITSRTRGRSTVPERLRIFYETLEKDPDDILSYIIPSESNARDETFNILPLSIGASERWKGLLTKWRSQQDRSGKHAVVVVTMSYLDAFSTRPVSMVYTIFHDSITVDYGLKRFKLKFSQYCDKK